MQLKKMLQQKKFTVVVAVLVVSMVFALAGCGDNGNNGDNGGTVELVMGHPFSGEHPISRNILQPLAEELAEESNGRIQLTIHPAGAITSSGSVYEDVISGAFDIGWTVQGYTPGRYPLSEVVELPFLFESAEEASRAFWTLFQEHPALQEEYDEVKIMGFWLTDGGEILSKDLIQTPADLNGKRIRFSGPMQEVLVDSLGGVPVGMAAPEMYDALERGIVDGVTIGYSTIGSYRLHEVIDHVTSGLGMFASSQAVFMNQETWNSLSAEDQELISRLTEERMAIKGGEVYDAGEQTGRELALEAGVEIYEVSAEERQQFVDRTMFITEEWIADMEADGYPAQEVYDLLLSIIADLRN